MRVFILSWNGIPIGVIPNEVDARDHAMYYSRNANCTITVFRTELYNNEKVDMRVGVRVCSFRNGKVL